MGALAAVGGFLALRPPGRPTARSVMCGATSAIAVVVSCVVFGPGIGLVGLFGSMLAWWEDDRPLGSRLGVGAVVATAMTASMALGVSIARLTWAVVPAAVLAVVVAALAYHAFLLASGPGPLHLYYAAILGTYFGADPVLGARIVAVTAFSSLLTVALTVVALLVTGPDGPRRRAVSGARAAVDEYARGGAPAARTAAHRALRLARMRIGAARVDVELAVLDRRFDAAQCDGTGDGTGDGSGHVGGPAVPGRPDAVHLVRRALAPGSAAWFVAGRMALAAGLSGVITQTLGIGHAYWAMLTAALVLNEWTGRSATTLRALHRAAGTVLGLGVVAVLAAVGAPGWWSVAVVAVAVVGQAVLIPLNYALGAVCVTTMALLSIQGAGIAEPVPVLLGARLADTLVGATVAVCVVWLTPRSLTDRVVRAQTRRLRRSIAQREAGDPADERLRSRLGHELLEHADVVERDASPDRSWTAGHAAIQDRGYAVLR